MNELISPYDQAVAYVRASRDTSCSGLQRSLRIGYRQAMGLKERLDRAGVYDGIEERAEPKAARIMVAGVGGAGCNALEEVVSKVSRRVGTLALNMDEQGLARSTAEKIIHIGFCNQVSRLGAQAAYRLASQYRSRISEALEGARIVFITAGLGGTTGTGAAPLVAEVAREMGAVTIGVVATPLPVEDSKRHRAARKGLQKLQLVTDALFVLPQPDSDDHSRSTTMADIMRHQDGLVCELIEGVARVVNTEDGIALSIPDLKAVLGKPGKAMWGKGVAVGEGRASLAAERAWRDLMAQGMDVEAVKGAILLLTISREATGLELKQLISAFASRFAAGVALPATLHHARSRSMARLPNLAYPCFRAGAKEKGERVNASQR